MAGAIFFGFLGGLILNIMPCVLPVIGLKILSFVEQAGHNRRKAFCSTSGTRQVSWRCSSSWPRWRSGRSDLGWGQLVRRDVVHDSLTAVVFVMALSFMGVWEVPMPTFLGAARRANWPRRRAPRGPSSKAA